MVPELILTALVVGWICRGRFGRLADVRIQYAWLIFAPMGLFIAATTANYAHAIPHGHWVFGIVHVIALLMFAVLAAANRRIPGVNLVFLGIAVNLVAVVVNGGFMPAASEAIRSAFGAVDPHEWAGASFRHVIMGAKSQLAFLCDVIVVRRPFVFLPSVYSLGDLISSLGLLVAIVAIMRNPVYSARAAREV